MLQTVLAGIKPINQETKKLAKKRVDSLAKPLGSLGELEHLSIQIAGITGRVVNKIEKKCIIIMAADNGVVEEGVASAPQLVTLAQTKNFIKGKTGVAVLAAQNKADLMVIDIGINSDEIIPGVIHKKLAKGTQNIYKGPAMSHEMAVQGIEVGIEAVKKAREKGYQLLGVGEMGIGNTTTSAAVLKGLTGISVDKLVGKGGGITKAAYEKKKHVVKRAVELNQVNPQDPIDVIAKVGGFDIAGMVGVFLGAAYYQIPVVIDGFISVVATLVATKLNKDVKDYCIPSHKSEEIGYNIAIEQLGLTPMLNLSMRLGEGSGCPIAFSVIEFAMAMMNNMATFDEAHIDDDYLDEVRNEESYKV
ncbi:MAG: nicotinate-nucleotide--dimethylbenzimidazole phosphoribosyltransferase [Turicibacter sanguinis]|uniref:nicotinate-nucleotide--dimethylbenzimidazole phosphoribosyltransferase n=1 Tax=Turicibacter sanguinis TaxID=154288 RepID=UPI002F91E2CB